jgi:hypothetical protein
MERGPLGIPKESAKREAELRLDLVLRLTGRGDDLPLSLYNTLMDYREALKDYLHGAGDMPFDVRFYEDDVPKKKWEEEGE